MQTNAFRPVTAPDPAPIVDTGRSPHAKLRGVDLRAVRWEPGFWAGQFARCRDATLPHLLKRAADPETGHAFTNLRIAAGLEQGEFAGTHWQDEWIYKWIEAACYVYTQTRDERLVEQMDEIIDVIAKAQAPDGYIATQTQVRGWPRFQDVRHHELYTMGHMITAACAHRRITGKANFLDVAIKCADYLYRTFITRDPALVHFCFNPSQIMALVELYRTTGERRYLDLANVYIDNRGSAPAPEFAVHPAGSDQTQDRVPLREEQHVVGHMVLSTYLWCGATDAYMETGDCTLLEAVDRLWHDLVERKLYVHGGVCPIHRGLSIRNDMVWEAADAEYVLPNSTAYNETCAQIGNLMWNWRLLAASANPAHADVIELSIYNSILSGIGLDGTSWFYTNVLRWYGADHPLLRNDAHGRFQPGRNHVCCPSNLVRTVAGFHGYLYGLSDEGLWVHQYAANTLDCELLDGSRLRLLQETRYPWDGSVRITIEQAPEHAFAVKLRLPGWAAGAEVKVNGAASGEDVRPGTYLTLSRSWRPGDVIELDLPMRVRLVEGHPRIEATRNQVAVMRGPLVYCLEWADLPPGVSVFDVQMPLDVQLIPRYDASLLGGITVLEGDAVRVRVGDWDGTLYRDATTAEPEPVRVRLVPYHVWCNRGEGEMSVWLPLIRR